MMVIDFIKYQGSGNDFILIENINGKIPNLSRNTIQHYCHRHFGIGADGLIIIKQSKVADFYMTYYNSDGNMSSLCGNGSRCAVRFAHSHSLIQANATFEAYDGIHEAQILKDDRIAIRFNDIDQLEKYQDGVICDSGSPHYMQFVDNIDAIDLIPLARSIRNNSRFQEKGINVNYFQKNSSSEFGIRTYERGVENETLSCGTGVVATAIASHFLKISNASKLLFQTKGGLLEVHFTVEKSKYTHISLIGHAHEVFQGQIDYQM